MFKNCNSIWIITKLKILSFTHPRVFLLLFFYLHDFISSVEHKRRYFEHWTVGCMDINNKLRHVFKTSFVFHKVWKDMKVSKWSETCHLCVNQRFNVGGFELLHQSQRRNPQICPPFFDDHNTLIILSESDCMSISSYCRKQAEL